MCTKLRHYCYYLNPTIILLARCFLASYVTKVNKEIQVHSG